MKTVAVIVTYNRKAKLLACLRALAVQTVPCDILVVDNASTDGTAEAVSSLTAHPSPLTSHPSPLTPHPSPLTPHPSPLTAHPSPLTSHPSPLTYLNTGANLGGAGGFAFGIRKAVEAGSERIWIMDDDVVPRPNALAELLAADAALGSGYGWLSSKCLGTDGEICPMNRQRATPYRKLYDFGERRVPVQMASFVSLFFPAETVRRFGLPIADFFIWCDDLEWTRRVSRELPCYAVPSSVVVHDIAGTAASDLATDVPERIDRYFYAFRNEFYTFRREGFRGLAYYAAKVAKNLLKTVLFGRPPRRRRLGVLVHGVVSGLRFCPKVDMI